MKPFSVFIRRGFCAALCSFPVLALSAELPQAASGYFGEYSGCALILTRDRIVPVLWPVDDPYGGEQQGYATAFEEIRQRVEAWVRQVQSTATSGDNRGAE